MTARKLKGTGLLVGGIGTIGAGLVCLLTQTTPEWISIGLQIIGAIANVFGFTLVYPDKEKTE